MLNEVTESEKTKFNEQCREFVHDLNTIRKTTNNKYFCAIYVSKSAEKIKNICL